MTSSLNIWSTCIQKVRCRMLQGLKRAGWTEELNQAPNSNATFNRNVSHFPGKKGDPSSWLHITTIRCPEMGGESALKQIVSKHVILELDLFTMIFQWFCMDVFVSVVIFGEAECDIKSNMLGWEKQFQRFSMHNIISNDKKTSCPNAV